jgi:hypothetical protein
VSALARPFSLPERTFFVKIQVDWNLTLFFPMSKIVGVWGGHLIWIANAFAGGAVWHEIVSCEYYLSGLWPTTFNLKLLELRISYLLCKI